MKKVALVTAMILLGLATVGMAQPGQRGMGSCDNACQHPGMGMMGGQGMGGMCQGMGMRDGMRGGGQGVGMILRMGDELKLTPDQRDKLEGLVTKFQTDQVDQKAQLEKAQIQLRALMRDDKSADRDVLAAIDNVSRLRGEMMKMHYNHFSQAKAILTTDQINQLKEMRQDRMGKRMGRMGMGHPGMGMGQGMNNGNDDDEDSN